MALGGGGLGDRGWGVLTKSEEEHKRAEPSLSPYRPLRTASRVLCSSLFVIRDDEARRGVGVGV
jgi:hypothetical protein